MYWVGDAIFCLNHNHYDLLNSIFTMFVFVHYLLTTNVMCAAWIR